LGRGDEREEIWEAGDAVERVLAGWEFFFGFRKKGRGKEKKERGSLVEVFRTAIIISSPLLPLLFSRPPSSFFSRLSVVRQ